MNGLKETKLTLAMNCHRIVILHNENMNNKKVVDKFLLSASPLIYSSLLTV